MHALLVGTVGAPTRRYEPSGSIGADLQPVNAHSDRPSIDVLLAELLERSKHGELAQTFVPASLERLDSSSDDIAAPYGASAAAASLGGEVTVNVRSQHAICPDAQCPRAKINNIGYISKGYNIFYGSKFPSNFGIDPGFNQYGGAEIFEVTYNHDETAPETAAPRVSSGHGNKADGMYEIPDSLVVVAENGCQLSFSSERYETFQEFQEAVSESYSGGGSIGFMGVSVGGSYSREMRETARRMAAHDKEQICLETTCAVFNVKQMEYMSRPSFSDDFKAAIALASKVEDERDKRKMWFNLFDQFGTHFVSDMVLGSAYKMQTYIERTSAEKSTSSKLKQSAEMTASVDGEEMVKGLKALQKLKKKKKKGAKQNSWVK